MNGNMPLVQALLEYANEGMIPFHMPGHKMGKGFEKDFLNKIVMMDVTEIPGLDNLHHATGVIYEAQRLAAKAFGADESFFLVNGSTAGIHGMLLSVCRPGDKLIVPRNCHKSVWNAMVIGDIVPVYIEPEFDEEHLFATQIRFEKVKEALESHPDAKGIIVVHPNYYGMCADLEKIVIFMHQGGKAVLVDEAHGAHFIFHPDLPPSSGELGADIWVQSAHKTLPAFTQTAYLHCKGQAVDRDHVSRILDMLQSTSPSYPFMASLDWARNYMVQNGRERLDDLIAWVQETREKLEKHLGIHTLEGYKRTEVSYMDPTRLVIDVGSLGITGYQTEAILRKHKIQVEMSDWYHVVLICTVADTKDDFEKLYRAFERLKEEAPGKRQMKKFVPSGKLPKQILSPRKAFYSAVENIPLREAVGRISGGLIGAYPPGIPRFCPGELIDSEGVDELLEIADSGGSLFGTVDGQRIPVLKD